MLTRKIPRATLCAMCATALAAISIACSATPAPVTPNPAAPTVLVAFTPSVPDLQYPTLLPTVTGAAVQAPSPIVIVVTATPLPSPTAQVTPVRPATSVRVSPTPAETATLFPEGVPHVYVKSLRVEPATPKANEGGTFFVTFENASGRDDGFNWAVEIWDADNTKRPFGLTTPQNSPMPQGISNLTSTGWTVKGLGECRAFRARVVARDEADNRTPFIQPDGSILWLDFNVCP